MNETTSRLVEELAGKLGTTAEHLWGVLVRQAPISSSVGLASLVIFALALVWSFKVLKRKTCNGGDWYNETQPGMPWIPWSLGLIVFMTVVACGAGDIVAGFVNPEYWALRSILNRM